MMLTIFKFELKKLFCTKVNVIALAGSVIMLLLLVISSISEEAQVSREAAKELSGRAIDGQLLDEMKPALRYENGKTTMEITEEYEKYVPVMDTLDVLRHLAKGKSTPDKALCSRFNKSTNNGKNMDKVSRLLEDAIRSIIDAKDEGDIDSFFGSGQTTFLSDGFSGLDDFELICFLVIRNS